mgnify:CR=1 FL=1
MPKIELNLRIDGVDITKQEFVITVNGFTVASNTVKPSKDDNINSNPTKFGTFMIEESKLLAANHRERSAEIYKSVWRQFMLWRENQDIAISNVTSEVMEQFEAFLRSRNLSLNTISFNMRVLRSCYNKAIEKYSLADKQPFKRVYTGIGQTDKRALSIETIRMIKECRTMNREEEFARDLFMFSFYTRGMSFVDIAYLKHDNIKNGNLHYKRRKTGQSLTVKWEPCMQDIVNRYSAPKSCYLFPIIHISNGKERNQYRGCQNKVNKTLKSIAARCGVHANLTMYVARHSWANAAKVLNHPLELISYGMGHTSTKTTKIYLHSINMSQIDQLNSSIIDELLQ